MLEKRNLSIYYKIIFLVLCVLIIFESIMLTSTNNVAKKEQGYVLEENGYDISLMAVGDTKTITFKATPVDANQKCTWRLTWDSVNTSSATYNRVKDWNPYDYLSLSATGNSCTIRVIKYYTFAIRYTVYFNLIATSVDNPEYSAVCNIKLG